MNVSSKLNAIADRIAAGNMMVCNPIREGDQLCAYTMWFFMPGVELGNTLPRKAAEAIVSGEATLAKLLTDFDRSARAITGVEKTTTGTVAVSFSPKYFKLGIAIKLMVMGKEMDRANIRVALRAAGWKVED